MSCLGANGWWSCWSNCHGFSCAWLGGAEATSDSLAAVVHPVLNGIVWSLAFEFAHLWTFLADTSVCVWDALVLGLNSNALLACTACWWCWLDNISARSWDAALTLAATQVSSLLVVSLLVTFDCDILACVLSARDGTVGSAAASLAIRDGPLLTILVLSSVLGIAEWWAAWGDMSECWHNLSSGSGRNCVNVGIWYCESSMCWLGLCDWLMSYNSDSRFSWALCCGFSDLLACDGLAALSDWSISCSGIAGWAWAITNWNTVVPVALARVLAAAAIFSCFDDKILTDIA